MSPQHCLTCFHKAMHAVKIINCYKKNLDDEEAKILFFTLFLNLIKQSMFIRPIVTLTMMPWRTSKIVSKVKMIKTHLRILMFVTIKADPLVAPPYAHSLFVMVAEMLDLPPIEHLVIPPIVRVIILALIRVCHVPPKPKQCCDF